MNEPTPLELTRPDKIVVTSTPNTTKYRLSLTGYVPEFAQLCQRVAKAFQTPSLLSTNLFSFLRVKVPHTTAVSNPTPVSQDTQLTPFNSWSLAPTHHTLKALPFNKANKLTSSMSETPVTRSQPPTYFCRHQGPLRPRNWMTKNNFWHSL